MKAHGVFFVEPRKAEIREIDVPDPGPEQVQVRCVANGICMGEVCCFTGVENRGYPCLVGHEGIGVVTKVGGNVRHLREGDYVPSWKWATAENVNARGLCKFARPPADPAIVLTEPVMCIVSALYSYNITPGDRVLVLGAGFMGLLNVQGLAHCPLAELVVTDVKPRNVQLARAYGATEAIQANTREGEARLEELKASPFDLVVECAGAEAPVQAAADFARVGGRLAIFAWHHTPRAMDLGIWHTRGLTVLNAAPNIGADHNINSLERAVRLIERGTFDLTEMITHRHPVADVQQAMELAAERPENYIKGCFSSSSKMKTEIAIDGTRFFINGKPTYEGVSHRGRTIEGLLFNSRMIQAVFDDECPETVVRWPYPDTGEWDPDRNTREFCAHLPEYRAHGLLAVTVGLQGGGSIYTPDVYDNYVNSAYRPDGSFKQPYFDRLLRILEAADHAGMIVIVNYFYWKQVQRIPDEATVRSITERVSDWLLRTGRRNVLVDVANEAGDWWRQPLFAQDRIHELIDIVKATALNGRRLLVGSSSGGGESLASGKWLAAEDISMPHGNGLEPAELKAKLRRLRETDEYARRPRPIVVNEDSVFVENLEAAIDEYASWGFYCQGYGSVYRDRFDWTARPRETAVADLSGFQTLPVNWGINTPVKKAFFQRLKQITSGRQSGQ